MRLVGGADSGRGGKSCLALSLIHSLEIEAGYICVAEAIRAEDELLHEVFAETCVTVVKQIFAAWNASTIAGVDAGSIAMRVIRSLILVMVTISRKRRGRGGGG